MAHTPWHVGGRTRWALCLVLAFVHVHQGRGCGLGPSSDFDKTRGGTNADYAYENYNLDSFNWEDLDNTRLNDRAWSEVTYEDDVANKIKADTWSRGVNSRQEHLWATPMLYTHPTVTYSDYVYFIKSYFPYEELGPHERKIATLRSKQSMWNAAVIKFFYFCGYDPGVADATPKDAELRIDLFYASNGTRRTIWRVEDADKAVPPTASSVPAKANCHNRRSCSFEHSVSHSCHKCSSVTHWKYVAVRLPVSSEPYQIEITGLDGNTGDVAFDLVSFETLEMCAPTWVPYFGVFNDAHVESKSDVTVEKCAELCTQSSSCDTFSFDFDADYCLMGTQLTKGTSRNPNDMCWPAPDPSITTYELNCLAPAATYDVLLDSDGDYFVGAWQWENCVDIGTCNDIANVGKRFKIPPFARKNYKAIMDGFSYYFVAATLKGTRYRRFQNVTLTDTLSERYLDTFKPLGTVYAWCTQVVSLTESTFQLVLYKVTDPGGDVQVTSSSRLCVTSEAKRPGFIPFRADASFAHLRVEELLTTAQSDDLNSNTAFTGQRLMIDVPLGLGCFSGFRTPDDAQEFSNNDVPDCLVRCHGSGKPVAALRGASCACLDTVPYTTLQPSRDCNKPCYGERWMCGGHNEHSFYTASCPDDWLRVSERCYKKFTDSAVDNAEKAHALCTKNNAELFTPMSSFAYQMTAKQLLLEGQTAYMGYKRLSLDEWYDFAGRRLVAIPEIFAVSIGSPDCMVVTRSGETVSPANSCSSPAEVICQKVDGWGTQELAETADLVKRTASSNTAAFANQSQWWSPSEQDSRPQLEWWFSKEVLVSGFKITSNSNKLLENFHLKYKEDYLSTDPERFYATNNPADIFEFSVTNNLAMNGEFTVYIHMAYPKVSNWFAILPTRFDPEAEVKVTLLGSSTTEGFTAPGQLSSPSAGRLDLAGICRGADHTVLTDDGFTLLNTQPEILSGHSSVVHVYEKSNQAAFQFCQPRMQCFRTGDSNVLCNPYKAVWQTRRASSSGSCTEGFFQVLGHCSRESDQALSQEAGAKACNKKLSTVLDFNTVEELTFYGLTLASRQSNNSLYLGFRRDGDGFVNLAGEPLAPEFNRMWAPNEPSSAGDCVILDADSGFLAKVVDCSAPYHTACQPMVPRNSPDDFAYQGDSFNSFHFFPDTGREWDHNAASEYCWQKGTSLAVPRDQPQLDFIKSVMAQTNLDTHGDEWTTVETGALGAVLMWPDAGNPNVTVTMNNIKPAPTAYAWNMLEDGMSSYRSCAYATEDSKAYGARCSGSSSEINYPICQYHACYASDGSEECVFPFRYKGRTYGHCTRLDSSDGTAWCPIRLVAGEASRTNGSFVPCLESCPVRQCPLGFLEIPVPPRQEPLCLLVSSFQDEALDVPRTPEQQIEFCERRGSRPLSLESTYHYSWFKDHIATVFPEIHPVVFDGFYWNAEDPHIITGAGRRLPSYVSDFVETSLDTDLLLEHNLTCLVMSDDTIENVPCSSGAAYHVCEANVEYTQSGPAAGELCQFPFLYGGRRYSSCADDTDRGQAWCATGITTDGQVDGDNWGFCSPGDHRTVRGPASPAPCQLPFIARGVLFESCTKTTGYTSPDTEGRYWCSTENDARGVMSRPDAWGECHENLWPPENIYCESPFNGTKHGECFYLHHVKFNNTEEAAEMCESLNADLAIPETKEHQISIEEYLQQKENKSYFQNFDYVRTSAYKIDGVWSWDNATGFDFTNWADGVDPTADGCVFLDVRAGRPYRWTILGCDTPAYAVCHRLCPPAQIEFEGSCLEVSTNKVKLSLAEAECAAKDKRLVMPEDGAQVLAMRTAVADRYPDRLPAMVGLVVCRYSYKGFMGQTAAERRRPRTTDGEVAPWMVMGVDYQYEIGFPCPELVDPGMYMTLEKINARIPLLSREHNEVEHHFICSPDLEDPCPPGYYPYDDHCFKLSNTTATYHEAQVACHLEDAELIRPRLYNEYYFAMLFSWKMNTQKLTRGSIWLGYDKIDEDNYIDPYGNVGNIETSHFQDSPDDGDCTILKSTGDETEPYLWHHRRCDQPAYYACQYRGQKIQYSCPDDFPLWFQGECFQISSRNMTFAQAEVECAMRTDGYSKLLAPEADHVSWFGYLAARFDGIWVGLDDRNQDGVTNSDGEVLEEDVLARLPQPARSARRRRSTGGCMALQDGGYRLTDCQEKRPYVCQLVHEPTCPVEFVRHYTGCYQVPDQHHNGNKYAKAEMICALSGGFVAADRSARQADFLKAMMGAVNHTSYWIGLSSDEEDEASLFYPDWEAFNVTGHSRFAAPPTMVAPACTVATAADGFATWQEAPCNQANHIICHYHGLPTCPSGYTALPASGYTCIKFSASPTTHYWEKADECFLDGPNCHLAVVSSARAKQEMLDFVRSSGDPRKDDPFWIKFRGPSGQQNYTVGSAVQNARWIDYHEMTVTPEVAELQANGTTSMIEIWRDKCATLDTAERWLRNDCLEEFGGLCEHTVCYSERGHQCIFPFIGPEDGVVYDNCTALDESDIFQPYCATELNSTGHATRVEKCLSYCFFKKPKVKCYDPPLRPPYENETTAGLWRADWTTDWDGVEILGQGQAIGYFCPEGYEFDNIHQGVMVVMCGNWTWEAPYGINVTTCQPVQCPRALPNFNTTGPMDARVVDWSGSYEYLTTINFTCPTGHVFEGVSRRPEEADWSVNPSNWSQLMWSECSAAGQWVPDRLPDCVLFDCLGAPPEPPAHVSSDWDNTTVSYGHQVRYWCTPGVGWAFPSDGAVERVTTCLVNGTWSLPELSEDCILTPCPEPPPEKVGNQSFTYGLVLSNYTCPEAWEFPDGRRHLSVECLLETKVWEPAEVPPCQRRRCDYEPPETLQRGMKRKWPKLEDGSHNYELDVIITYKCPKRKLTWEFNETVQEVMCIHDTESDLMIWEPSNITLCNRTIPLPPYDGIVLPPPPPVDVTYPATTDYYWSTIEQNTTAVPAGSPFTTGNGPFGFRSSVKLPGGTCMLQKGFMRPGDTCVHNPATCVNGISFSLWEKSIFDSDLFTPRDELPYRYLISTGGDDKGSPGVAIYLQGMILGALVSTGSQYWKVETVGLMPNNTWNNIGVRWRAPAADGSEQEFTGLQLYINQQPAALVVHGETASDAVRPPLQPPEFMVGCHKSSGDTKYSHFCPCEFDEVAMWKRALLANESMYFIGGLEEDFAGMSAEVFAEMLREVDLTDPDQQSVAVSIASKIADRPDSEALQVDPLGTPGQKEEQEREADEGDTAESSLLLASRGQISKMHVLADLLFTMTAPEAVKPNQTSGEIDSFLNLVGLASQLLENKHQSKWKGIEIDNDKKEPDPKDPKKIDYDGEAADMADRLESFAMASVVNLVPEVVNGSIVDLFVHKRTPNVEMYVEQRGVVGLREQQMAPLPSDRPRKLDSIQVPTVVFRKPGCEDARISTVFSKYDNYGGVTPHRFLRNEFKTKHAQYLEIDSAVLSLRLVATRDQEPAEECLPTIDDLRRSPVRTAHRHHQPKPALREPLFHEDEIVSDVFRRHCVWWNAELLRGRGQWDATGCVVLDTNDFFTKCACKVIGQYAVVAEKVEPKIVDIDGTWLILLKRAFHVTSLILLLLYVYVVWKNDSLWEMFHQMRMVTALLLFLGGVFMMESDKDSVRESRHSCTAVAAFLQLTYLAAGAMVACEGYACFRALAFGVVGGKLGSYMSLSFGLSLLSLGYALGLEIHRYGDDPQCMMGWEADVKLIFFAPMAFCLLISLVAAFLIMCNMSTPQLRKQSMAIDHDSVCYGYVYFSIYFVVTWSAGAMAYVRYEVLENLPTLYPLFQFMNAATGLVFFVCQGLLSRRFLAMLLRRGRQRQKLLLAYARHEDEPDPVDEKVPSESEELSSSSSESEEEEEEDGSGVEPDPEAGGVIAHRETLPQTPPPPPLQEEKTEQEEEPSTEGATESAAEPSTPRPPPSQGQREDRTDATEELDSAEGRPETEAAPAETSPSEQQE